MGYLRIQTLVTGALQHHMSIKKQKQNKIKQKQNQERQKQNKTKQKSAIPLSPKF